MADIYFWRQMFVVCTSILLSMDAGFMIAFPSVLGPAITSVNSTDIKTTGDHASWIASMNGLGGLLGAFVNPPIQQNLGRKMSHCCLNVFLIVGWIIMPFANSVTPLYVARFIQGISVGGIYIGGIIISEYVHPNRRGYFLILKKVAIATGILCCHAMSAFWTWRQIAMFAAMPSFLASIMTLFWPESPSYLTLKRRFAECKVSFRWLNGNSEESQMQLKSLLEAQKKKFERSTKLNARLKIMTKKFMEKDFQRVFLISSVLTLSIDLCGRFVFTSYLIQIMRELLDNDASALYFTIGADLLILLALSLSAVVVNFAKRRAILFYSGSFSVFLMLLIGVLVFLKTVYTFSTYFLWFTALLIIFQCFISNIGLIPVAFTIISEIIPLEFKGLGAFVSCFVFTFMYTICLKITPVLIESTGLYGTYAIYGVLLAICLVVLYKTLPETKDRTLQDIEDNLNNVQKKDIVVKEQESLIASSTQK